MSDASRHKLTSVVEVTYGTCPANPVLKTIRNNGVTLALSKGTLMSDELRSDRQITDEVHGARIVGGDITAELSYGSFDDQLEAALMGTWAVKRAPYTASTISAAAADNSINDSANLLPLLDPGDKVTISGFTGASTTANQVGLVVVSSTVSKMVLSGGVAIINDAAGEAVTVTTLTNRLIAGTTRRSFSLLRQYADLTTGGDGPYHLFSGCEYDKLNFKASVNAIVMLVMSVMGQALVSTSDTAPSGSSVTAANSNRVMNSFRGTLKENGSTLATITELDWTLENGLGARPVIGTDLTLLPSVGRSNANGTITSYFANSALFNKFVNETESTIDITVADAAGQKYRIYFPRVKYNGGQPDVKGQGPVTIALPFQALMDATLGTQVLIDRTA